MSDSYTTKDVIERLDQMIAIMKLANKNTLDDIKKEIQSDPISKKIIQICSDEGLGYSELAEKVADQTKSGKSTVELRITKLREMKILSTERDGKKVVYRYSGLLE